MTNAHDPRTLEDRLQWIADWSEPGIDLADAGTAREALDTIKHLRAELARAQRNRDMWKGQCERQADELARVRKLEDIPHAALYRAVEQLHAERAAHEATKAEFAAFRQEVSEAMKVVREYTDRNSVVTTMEMFSPSGVSFKFADFIIPPPDPITEWLHKSGYEGNAAVEQAVRAYAKERE